MASLIGQIIKTASNCGRTIPIIRQQQIRYASYKSSPFVVDLGEVSRKYAVTKDADDWKYVERILPPVTVPDFIRKDNYTSNWKPQAENLSDRPYFIARTKNHMLPVYLKTTHRGTRKLTYIRKIYGDIWLLEKEIRPFLQKTTSIPIRSQVNEISSLICFHGDYVNAIKSYLIEKDY